MFDLNVNILIISNEFRRQADGKFGFDEKKIYKDDDVSKMVLYGDNNLK